VPKLNEKLDESFFDKSIEHKTLDQVSLTPYSLPAGYTWCNLDLNDEKQAEELYNLLTTNYVEDDDAMFRFDYSVPFLRWALLPPGQPAEWLCGVRGGKKQRLFGFISGIPIHMGLNKKVLKMAEINFLCVHKDLRAKRLAPVMIKEITRRVNLHNIWQAVYTAGVTIPTPIANATYWHRSLNPKKLVEVRFSSLPPGTPMARYLKLQKLPA
jgi:glycylpeptide N-tetradecanoyltransferase